MAYRFLLEVPDSLAAEANVAVGEAGDAQIVVVRPHGRTYDEPYVDLTIAAHSLRVIDSLYRWFDSLGASRPDVRLVLHSGERVSLEAHDRATMVSAIRRDQPWVERTIPKIGEHDVLDTSTALERLNVESGAAQALATMPVAVEPEDARPMRIKALNHVGLIVLDMPRAERFYTSFLAMDLIGRARQGPDGTLVLLDGNYSWEDARSTGTEADVVYLRNGPLTLALHGVGRGARLERSLLDHLSVRVDATTYTELKGQVLMRSYEMLASAQTAFMFRDPFGIIWEITLQGPAEAL
jgi:catechol 2,3-dioxygenase-like lactoylglutathione lyase family enzyme